MNTEEKFRALADRWQQETLFYASTTAITSNFWYYRIVGMGIAVVPYILREVANGGGHWSLALKAITGENPVPPTDAGNRNKVAAAWLQWGRQNGFIE